MQRMKKIATGLVVAMLSLPWTPAFAHPEATLRQKCAALVGRILRKPSTTSTTVARPQQQPSVVVKRVWIGGPPWLGGHEATVVVKKAPETRQIQTGRGQAQIQPRRVWVGGAPWLGGYETWVIPK